MNLYLSEKLDRYSFTAVRLCLAHCCEFGMPLKSILKVSLHREKLRLDFVNYSITTPKYEASSTIAHPNLGCGFKKFWWALAITHSVEFASGFTDENYIII